MGRLTYLHTRQMRHWHLFYDPKVTPRDSLKLLARNTMHFRHSITSYLSLIASRFYHITHLMHCLAYYWQLITLHQDSRFLLNLKLKVENFCYMRMSNSCGEIQCQTDSSVVNVWTGSKCIYLYTIVHYSRWIIANVGRQKKRDQRSKDTQTYEISVLQSLAEFWTATFYRAIEEGTAGEFAYTCCNIKKSSGFKIIIDQYLDAILISECLLIHSTMFKAHIRDTGSFKALYHFAMGDRSYFPRRCVVQSARQFLRK